MLQKEAKAQNPLPGSLKISVEHTRQNPNWTKLKIIGRVKNDTGH
jgi:hypothetical protein